MTAVSDMEILLTNDDGIDAPGITAMADDLESLGEVTVVAPASNRSACGRAISSSVSVEETDAGYAVTGTPADCIVAGLAELCPDADVVVAGCNGGANLGTYTLGRSGTISAAVEATFFDVPAIATSAYIPVGDRSVADVTTEPAEYAAATRVTRYLVEQTVPTGVLAPGTYLNVNVPLAATPPLRLECTRPSERYEMTASRDGVGISIEDGVWRTMDPNEIPDAPGTDRRAVAEGAVSVSPLTPTHAVDGSAEFETIVRNFSTASDAA